MIRFVIPFLGLFIGSLFIYGQSPGSEIDFGRYNGKLDEEPVAKSPKNRTYYPLEETGKLDLSKAKVHYSKVFKGDTTSMSYNGYFIEFNPAHIYNEEPDFTYYSDYVTNDDWNLFRRYVLDSTARRILLEIFGSEGLIPTYDEDGRELYFTDWNLSWKPKLNYKKETKNEQFTFLAHMFYSESERFNEELLLDEREIVYEYTWVDLDSLVSSQKDIHNNSKRNLIGFQKFDAKYWRNYRDYFVWEKAGLYRDSTFWIKDSSSWHFGNLEDQLVTYYNWHEEFKSMPVSGITQPQARAYLNWLQWNHNNYLEKHDIPFYVVYELPENNSAELTEVQIPEFDLSHWRITNAQYKEFVEFVRDSIARRIIGQEFGTEEFLVPILDDELQEKDESLWNLDRSGRIDWKRKTSGEKIEDRDGQKQKAPYGTLRPLYYPFCFGDTNLIDKRKLNFEYYFMDFKTASIEFERNSAKDGFDCKIYNADNRKWDKHCLNEPQSVDGFHGYEGFRGKDLNLSHVNANCEATDIFSHEDRSQYIIKDIINVYPNVLNGFINRRCFLKDHSYEFDLPREEFCEHYDCVHCPQPEDWDEWFLNPPQEYDFDSQPNALIKEISYAQFRAYWWWWNTERRKEVNGNPVIADYIPSEEEFVKLQNGEDVIHPKEVHELPTPTFNYVMKFYRIQPSTNN
ncbi:MAG: hypothetical protein H6600_09685 [Flavobacteriales bacterium]|nr:hypothetical protein [Flavobacteriales bacterium]MCB9198721.1 hypothetical protein [Flavobacteriales bacterium]